MQQQPLRNFSAIENETWQALFSRLDGSRRVQAHPMFSIGVELLGLHDLQVPSLEKVNAKLGKLTGWKGVPVKGLEDNTSFFKMLAQKMFPIGNFIRDKQDLSYTPEPDIFHDLYGHLPFFTNKSYADFCQNFGAVACRYESYPEAVECFGRLFWFGVEFPVIKTPVGRRIFGGGILSSFTECHYALSDKPEVRPFDLKEIRDRPYKIDELQSVIYELECPDQLFGCLKEFETLIRKLYHSSAMAKIRTEPKDWTR